MNLKKLIGALIVTYNPEIKTLLVNIQAIVSQVDYVLIIDNGSANANLFQKKVERIGSETISIIYLKQNRGIGAAQNVGMNKFEHMGYDWVVTLDQDTVMPDKAVRSFLSCPKVENHRTGILAPQYIDRNWSKAQRKQFVKPVNQLVERDHVISSGNFIKVAAWRAVGGFDEFLFIDFVDDDFDMKLKIRGYKIWEITSIKMMHSIGEVIHRPILATILFYKKSTVLYDHSPAREFFLQRNRIIMDKRYASKKIHKYIPEIIISIIHLRSILIYSAPRFSKLMAGIKGIIQGMHYKVNGDKQFQLFLKQQETTTKNCEEK